MNFTLDIFIKENDLKTINIIEKLVSWGSEMYSQTPPVYDFKRVLFFEKNIDLEYYQKYYTNLIGSDIKIDDYLSLRLLGNNMSDLETTINMRSEEIMGNCIIKFLEEISKLSTFAIFIEEEDELISKKYIIRTYEEIVDIFGNSLNWDALQGALIIKR